MTSAQSVERRQWWSEDDVVASLDFGLATETRDFDGAFRLLHDNYVRDGHMTPHPTGRRVSVFNALPSARVFVAREGDRVVGTVALFPDTPIGLPMDQVYREELAGIRARGVRLGEAGTLTVHRDYRASGAAILARLFRLLSLYAAEIARLDELVMVVAPHHRRFYETCFPIRQFGSLRPYPRINGTRVIGLAGDVGRTRALIREAEARVGPVDVLVNNSATNIGQGPALAVTDEMLDKMVEVNLKAALRLVRLTVPGMIARGGGSVLNLASISGLRPQPGGLLYSVTKAGLLMMTRCWAREFGPHGVRVNAIAPGLIQTDFARALWDNPQIRQASESKAALKRIGQPDEIGGVAVFLASKAGAFICGQCIIADGGVIGSGAE